jgi:hypothetical protein
MSPSYTSVRAVVRLLASTGLLWISVCAVAAAVDNPGVVQGVAWTSEHTPIPAASIRLRNLETGKIAQAARTSTAGQFAFEQVGTGHYLVELVSDTGRVLAVGPSFHLEPGQTVSTAVQLPTRRSWYASMFANTAAAVIAAASSVGLTALGSQGPPISPQ